MSDADHQPTLPLGYTQPQQTADGKWVLASSGMPAPAPRRRIWPWIVAFAVVVVLGIVAWFAAEAVARDIVTDTIRDQVVEQLDLPADQQIDVEVPGAIIPQLVVGTFGEVRLQSDDVPFETFVGDISVVARDVPIRGGGEIGSAQASAVMDEQQLRDLLAAVDGFPADSVALAAPDVTMSTEFEVFGLTIPVGVALTPSAAEGDIVLTPSSFQLAGAEVDAEAVRDQLGPVADVVARDWSVCIAAYLPAGLTLTGISVVGDTVEADFDVHGGIVSDPALQQNGTCG